MKTPKLEFKVPAGFYRLTGKVKIQVGDCVVLGDFDQFHLVKIKSLDMGILNRPASDFTFAIRHKSKG